MTVTRQWATRLFLAVLAVAVAACGRGPDPDEPGLVAMVNGRPITLERLEHHHDLTRLGAMDAENPTVERLRAEYGASLGELIVLELVEEALAKAGKTVTDEDLARAEALVRADYPGQAFDEMLVDENIDLARWRESLRDRLALERFFREVLGEKAKVAVQEAADYYKENTDQFSRPPRVRFVLIRGGDKAKVEKALAAYRESRDPAALSPSQYGVSAQELRLQEKNLPREWRAALSKLKPGEASGLMTGDFGAEVLVFLEKLPQTVLDPAQAYPQIERTLADAKLNQIFAGWLATAVAAADITVSRALFEVGPDAPTELAAGSPPPGPDVDIDEESRAYIEEQVKKALLARREAGDAARDVEARDEDEATVPASAPPRVAAPNLSAPALAVPETPVAPSAVVTSPASPAIPAPPESAPAPTAAPASSAPAPPAPASSAASEAAAPAPAPAETRTTDEPTARPAPSAVAEQPAPSAAPGGPGTVEFLANKASWIILSVDDGPKERVYVKAGKVHPAPFKRKLSVQFGSPSDVTWRFGGKEERVESSTKDVKTVDFP